MDILSHSLCRFLGMRLFFVFLCLYLSGFVLKATNPLDQTGNVFECTATSLLTDSVAANDFRQHNCQKGCEQHSIIGNYAPQSRQMRSGSCTQTVRLALYADYSMLQKTGSIANLRRHLSNIIEATQAAYNVLDVEWQIVDIIVSPCATCDGLNTTTNGQTLLSSFMDWGNTQGNFSQPYDVAMLWTNRNLNGDVVGLTYSNGACTEKRYSICQDYASTFQKLRSLAAHELAHALGAQHDASSSPYIMNPSINQYATAFSATSQSEMRDGMTRHACFDACNSCFGTLAASIRNFNGTDADFVWNATPNNLYRVRYRIVGSANWQNTVTVSADTVYHATGLLPCSPYEFLVESVCGQAYSNAKSVFTKGLFSPTYWINYPAAGQASITWYSTGYPVQLRLRESGTTVWNTISNNTLDSTYLFANLAPCKNYEVNWRVNCGNNAFGRDTILQIRGARASSIATQAVSTTQRQITFFVNNIYQNVTFRLRVRVSGSSTWLYDADNALPNTPYTVGSLLPCTNYEAQVQAYCTGEAGNTTFVNFNTASLALISATPESCSPYTEQYNLAVTVGYLGMNVGTPFTISHNGTNYPFVYNGTSPQTVILPNLTANGQTNVSVQVSDNSGINACIDALNFDAPEAACQCSIAFSENFDGCAFPPQWTSQAIGTNAAATWNVGTTHDGNSIDGSCMLFFDDDYFDNNGGETIVLTSPTVNLSNYSSAELRFDYNFNTIGGYFKVEVWNGSAWVLLSQLDNGFCGFWGCSYQPAKLDITAQINAAFRFRITYHDGDAWDWYAAIDNIEVCGYSNISTCNAGFAYLTDTLCAQSDHATPSIQGFPIGAFSATPDGLTIDPATGNIDPQTSAPGLYQITYTPDALLVNGNCSQSFSMRILPSCQTNFRPRIWLQGAYNSQNMLMRNDLRAANLLPLSQPYNAQPWNYGGTESLANAGLFPANTVDWVLVQLRRADMPQTIVGQKAALLFSDGWVADVGAANNVGVYFNSLPEGYYIVCIRHRNHLPIASANPVWIGQGVSAGSNSIHDLGSSNAALGNGSQTILLNNNYYATRAGDADGNGVINIHDFNVWASENPSTNAYKKADFSMNKHVNILDFSNLQPNLGRVAVEKIR